VALVARESSGLSDSLAGKINKRIVQPAHPVDLVNAVATLAELAQQRPAMPSEAELSQEELFAKMLRARAERRDIRGLLSLVNASGPFRFTSVLRFDGEQLTSVWTYDRSFPDVDSFPVDKAISASYCARVRESLAPFELSDSAADPRVADHPARHQVMSYCGAPLWTREGTLYGTLCHFDESPRMYPARTMAKLEHAAGLLRDFLVDAAQTTPAGGRP
jgi:GAF domain-containing protein